MAGNCTLPVYSGGNFLVTSNILQTTHPYFTEIQVKDLGMKIEVYDPSGNNIEHTGQPGELVCSRPHVSLPIAFWGDDSGKKLKEAYFSTYPGMLQQVMLTVGHFDEHTFQGFGDRATSWLLILLPKGS